MASFDYNAPAELFLSKPAKGSRKNYRRFKTAAEALHYAVEDLRIPKAFGAWLEVGDERFNSSKIQRLYEADDYPLAQARVTERPRAALNRTGPLSSANLRISTPARAFKTAEKRLYEAPNYIHMVMLAEPGFVISAGRFERRYAAFEVSQAHMGDAAYFKGLV